MAKYGAVCNSLDPGGALTPLNECVIEDAELWAQIMDETPLKRWATPEEIAEKIVAAAATESRDDITAAVIKDSTG